MMAFQKKKSVAKCILIFDHDKLFCAKDQSFLMTLKKSFGRETMKTELLPFFLFQNYPIEQG